MASILLFITIMVALFFSVPAVNIVVYITLEQKFYWIVLYILRNLFALTLVREQQSLVDVGTHSQQFSILRGIPTTSVVQPFNHKECLTL
jgi:hypothetical protein